MVSAVLDKAAKRALSATRFADVRWYEQTSSTNQLLLEDGRAGGAEGIVVGADHQTAGRGRLGRRWEAPPGSSLLVSVLLRPSLPIDLLHLATATVGLAVAEAVADETGVTAGLKWPNDLVVSDDDVDRKLGGILAETDVDVQGQRFVVIGLGLNVNWPQPLPTELAGIATALNHLTRRAVDRRKLLVAFLLSLESRYAELTGKGGTERTLARYRRACVTIGQHVRAELPSGVLMGIAVDVNDAGHLVVEADDGTLVPVVAGDVIHVRRAHVMGRGPEQRGR